MATRQRRSREQVLAAEIRKQKDTIDALDKKLDEEKAKYKELTDEYDSLKHEELLKEIESSGKSYDEIVKFLQS